MISISIGLVYIVTRQTGSFSCQRQNKKERKKGRKQVAIFSGDAYEGNKEKKIQFNQTADFCFGNGRINKPFATTATA